MKRKRINKRLLYVILSIIIVSVLSLTIAYAVLSSNLTISGSTEVSGSSWNISVSKYDITKMISDGELDTSMFKFYDNGLAVGDAELINEPIISGTTISGIQISLVKPGDVVGLYYDVTNNGTIPAKVESIVKNTASFSSTNNNASDIEFVTENWFSEINLYPFDSNFAWDDVLDVGYILCPGETIYLEFYGEINYNATSVSSSNITVSNLGGTINFVQADTSTCS